MNSIFHALLLLLALFFECQGRSTLYFHHGNYSSVSAIIVFGDSTADPGNNNYVKTAFKSNFPPYGRDFNDHIPTGRFSNGRLVADFVAAYAGIKDSIPPYLDPTLTVEELTSGVSFASAGCGYDPLTPAVTNVIPLSTQLHYFKEYKSKLTLALGKQKTDRLIRDAVYCISAGTNDLVVNYYVLPFRRKHYTLSEYQRFLLHQTQQLIQDLWKEGARKIAIAGLPPLGCLPIVMTLKRAPFWHSCIEPYSIAAEDYNGMLQNLLESIQNSDTKPGLRIFYLDIYNPLLDMIKNPEKFGFEDANGGCCGTGLIETAILCNPKTPTCGDASKYVFWDSIHPTQKAYFTIFQGFKPIIDTILKL